MMSCTNNVNYIEHPQGKGHIKGCYNLQSVFHINNHHAQEVNWGEDEQ